MEAERHRQALGEITPITKEDLWARAAADMSQKPYKALGIDRSCLLALHGRDETVERSARNLDRTTLTTVEQLNAWDIMRNRTLLLTKEGLSELLA